MTDSQSTGQPGSGRRYFNYPRPQQCEAPYKAPPPGKNPVMRGLPLYYSASVISSIGLLQSLLWGNTGFHILRAKKELEDVPARYDPTVIPILEPSELDDSSYVAGDELLPRKPSSNASTRFWSSVDYHEAYLKGTTTPTAVAEALLPLVRRDVEKPSSHSTAFMESNLDAVRAAAAASTARYKAGKPLGLLDGVPCVVKDEVDVVGYKRKIGTTMDFPVKGTSWAVQQWLDAGVVLIAKASMHELGLDTTNNNPNHGTPLNPYNSQYYTGGSSGGSAYAVAAGIVPFALGADGGGSIRIPASFCGLYGLKTTHGRISRLPTVSIAESTGVMGPIAANMVDLEASYRTMSTPDPSHPASRLFPRQRIPQRSTNKRLLGVYQPWLDRADPTVSATFQRALTYFRDTLHYTLVPITLPLLHEGQISHAMTILAEISSGHPDVTGLTGPNKVLIAAASKMPAVDLLQAQKMRQLLMQHLAHLFAQHPGLVIVTPTSPIAGWHIKGGAADLKYGVSDANTSVRNMEYVWLANLVGCPCISFPAGYVDPVGGEGKVPVGMMGMAEWAEEDALIEFGYDGERWLGGGGKEALEGGRRMPGNWVDVFDLVK